MRQGFGLAKRDGDEIMMMVGGQVLGSADTRYRLVVASVPPVGEPGGLAAVNG